MKYCYKCGTQLSDEMIFCHNCGEKAIIPNSIPANKPNVSYTTPIETKSVATESNASIEPVAHYATVIEPQHVIEKVKPKKRIAMGIVGMVLSEITLFFSVPLAISAGSTLNYGSNVASQAVFWICFIPAIIMTILSTIFSFVSRFQSGFKNFVTRVGVMGSIINNAILLFALLVYISV